MELPKRAVIILPTYNEKENIEALLTKIFNQQIARVGLNLFVLVVDDSSPDGTASVVREFIKSNPKVELLSGKKKD